MKSVDRERLREALQASGKSARGVSVAARLGPTAIKDILSGRSRDPGVGTLSKIADQLGIRIESLMGADLPTIGQPAAAAASIELPILYEVAAGAWLAQDDLRQGPIGHYQAITVPEFDGYPQWLEQVVGDSMNRLVPPGALLHVVDAVALGYEARHDDLVVVLRTRAQGAFLERSVKQVALTPKGPEFWPRSFNPRWSAPLEPTDGASDSDDVEVRVVGLVVRAYLKFSV